MKNKAPLNVLSKNPFCTVSVIGPTMNGSGAHIVIKAKAILGYKDKKVLRICCRAEKTTTARSHCVYEFPSGISQIVRPFGMTRKACTCKFALLMEDAELMFRRNVKRTASLLVIFHTFIYWKDAMVIPKTTKESMFESN